MIRWRNKKISEIRIIYLQREVSICPSPIWFVSRYRYLAQGSRTKNNFLPFSLHHPCSTRFLSPLIALCPLNLLSYPSLPLPHIPTTLFPTPHQLHFTTTPLPPPPLLSPHFTSSTITYFFTLPYSSSLTYPISSHPPTIHCPILWTHPPYYLPLTSYFLPPTFCLPPPSFLRLPLFPYTFNPSPCYPYLTSLHPILSLPLGNVLKLARVWYGMKSARNLLHFPFRWKRSSANGRSNTWQ